MSCLIDSGALFDCSNQPKAGIYKWVMLYNKVDWDAAVKVVGVDGTISDITNALTKKAYKYESADKTNIIPSVTLRPIDGNADKFDHKVVFSMFENDQAHRNNVSKLRFAPVVAIIYKNDGLGQVYGNDQGMYLLELVDLPQDPNTGNILVVTVGTKGTQPGESQLPVVVDAGTPATTLALIESLTIAGV